MRLPSKSPITDLRRANSRVNLQCRSFTLVEVLVATVILILIMALVASLTGQVGKIWKTSTAKIESFQAARAAYGTMTMRLRQATLNTYLDYYDSSGNVRTPADATTFVPLNYARTSELHFVVGQASTIVPVVSANNPHPTQAVFFQAPLGFTLTTSSYGSLPNILNACGYYIEFNSDAPYYPSVLGTSVNPRYRYRLMEFLQPTESFAVYGNPTAIGSPPNTYDSWYWNFLPPNVTQSSAPLRMLAENIIALVILPELSPRDQSSATLATNYAYDTRAGTITTPAHNQLPPLLRVVMVAIDEPSAQRLSASAGSSPPAAITTALNGLFQTYQTSTDLNTDLNTLASNLSAQKINFRVFDTDIAIRGAKWSIQ